MDRAVHAAAPAERRVGSVDDGVDVEGRDVAGDDFDHASWPLEGRYFVQVAWYRNALGHRLLHHGGSRYFVVSRGVPKTIEPLNTGVWTAPFAACFVNADSGNAAEGDARCLLDEIAAGRPEDGVGFGAPYLIGARPGWGVMPQPDVVARSALERDHASL